MDWTGEEEYKMETTETKAPWTGHTPGPWKASEDVNSTFAVLSDKINAYGNFIVCECRRNENELTDQDRANAALIARAPMIPELLAMLEELHDMALTPNDWLLDERQDKARDARALIARVEGRRVGLWEA